MTVELGLDVLKLLLLLLLKEQQIQHLGRRLRWGIVAAAMVEPARVHCAHGRWARVHGRSAGQGRGVNRRLPLHHVHRRSALRKVGLLRLRLLLCLRRWWRLRLLLL